MTNPAFHRTNLNLHASDVAFLQHTYGYGWTEQARELLHERVEQIRQHQAESKLFNEQHSPIKDISHETNVDSGTDSSRPDSPTSK